MKATYSLSADGRVRLARVLSIPGATPSRQALQAMFGSLRWPLKAPLPGSTWNPGDAWLAETDGDLQISLGLQGGYEVTGIETLELGRLPTSWGLKLAGKVSLKAGFTLSGRLLVGLAAGEKPGWMRCVVRRGSVRGLEFGLGIDVVAEAGTEDLPEDPQAFLSAALGVELGAAGEWLKLVADNKTPDGFAAAVQAKLSPRIAAWLGKATDAVINRVGAADAYAKVQASIGRFFEGLNTLPAGAASLVAAQIDRLPDLTRKLDALSARLSAEGTRRWLDEHDLGILWDLGVEKVHETLADPMALEKLKTQVTGLREVVAERVDEYVSDWLSELRARSDMGAALQFLEEIESEKDLEALIASGLGELAELILDKSLADIDGARAATVYADIRARALQVQGLLKRLGELLADARKAKLDLSLGAVFASRHENTTLIDVEIDLSHPDGPRLAGRVCQGDCRDLLLHAGQPAGPVRMHACALEEARSHRSTVTITAFGSEWKSIDELSSRIRHDYVETEEGAVCLYTADTRRLTINENDTRRGHELAQNALLLRRLASGRKDDDLSFTGYQANLEVLSVHRPAPEEAVRAVLELARTLGLIDDVADYGARLAAEFGNPIGEFSATYRVSYRSDALSMALTELPSGTIAQVAIDSIRDYARVRAIDFNKASDSIGLGNRFNIEKHLAYDLFAGAPATLPDEQASQAILRRLRQELVRFAPARPGNRGHRIALGTNEERFKWHEAELRCLGLLRRLREELAKPAPGLDELGAISQGLLSMRADFLDLQRGNVIFLIFDRLIMAHDNEARAGLTSLELKMKPTDSEQTVRRLLVA